MRGSLSEQDLTDYALNELPAHDRIYVESMLAASEECREDICATIEMARLLEQGYERELVAAELRELALAPEQRAVLAQPHFTKRRALRDVIAISGAAAAIAVAVTQIDGPAWTQARTTAGQVATATAHAAASVQPGEGIDLAKALASLREMAEEGSKLVPISTDALPEPPAICTPPTLIMESAQLTILGDMNP